MSEWEPATDAEAAMRDALRTDDQESYFRILAGVDLLLPVSADALAGLAPLGWGTWSTGGRTHVLAFTSPAALQACLADYTGSARRVAYGELADTWPNLEWWLAVNPGLPIEGYLPAWFVAQLSRGDLRLPTRGPARDGIKTTQSAQELQAAARAANAAATGQSGGPIPPEERRAPDDRVAAGPVSPSSAGASGRGGATAVGPDEAAARGAGSAAPASGPVGPGGLPIRTPGAVLPSGLPSRVPASSLPEDGVGYGSFSGFAAGAGVHPAGPGGAGVHPAGPGGAGAEVGTVPAAYRPPAVPPVSGPPVSPVSGPSVSPVSGTPVPSSGAPAGVPRAAPPQDPRRPLPTRTPMAQTPSLPGHPAQPAAPARPETGDDSAAPPTGGQQALAGATRADPADYRDAPDRGYHPAPAADRSNPRAGDRGSPSAADRGGSSAVDHDSQSAADRGDQPAAAAKRGHDSDAAADRGPDPSAAAGGDQPAPTADRSHTADAAGEPGRAPDGSDKAAVEDRDKAAVEDRDQVGADDRDQVGADDRDQVGADDRDKAANDRDEAVAAADQSDQPTADQRPRAHGDQSAGALPRRPVTPPSERPASMAAAAQALASGRTAPAEVPARPAAPRPGLAPPVVPGAGGSERPPFGSTGSGRPGVAASSPPRGGTPVPADDDTDFAPANPVEHDLFDAADGGSTDAFLSTLLLAMVLLPVADSSRPGSSPGEPGFVFRTERVDGERFLVVFTSRDRLAERYAEPTRTVGVKFLDLIRNWPDPAWSFAVNPGTPIGATYPGAQIVALANWAAEAGLGADPEERDAKPAPLPQRVSDAAQHATIMQKTVPAEQVGYYLERGYDRVAGFVHRANEVEHLRTPADLFAALGLVHDGTPYTSDAEEAFVLRWPAYRPSLYRIPYGGQSEQALRAMDGWVIERPPFRGNGFAPGEGRDVVAEFKVDSVRLPHGAELWRMDADGGETMIAVFDCDAPMWRRVGAQ